MQQLLQAPQSLLKNKVSLLRLNSMLITQGDNIIGKIQSCGAGLCLLVGVNIISTIFMPGSELDSEGWITIRFVELKLVLMESIVTSRLGLLGPWPGLGHAPFTRFLRPIDPPIGQDL